MINNCWLKINLLINNGVLPACFFLWGLLCIETFFLSTMWDLYGLYMISSKKQEPKCSLHRSIYSLSEIFALCLVLAFWLLYIRFFFQKKTVLRVHLKSFTYDFIIFLNGYAFVKISNMRNKSINLKRINLHTTASYTRQKMKFSIKDLFSKCNQIRKKLRIWSHWRNP